MILFTLEFQVKPMRMQEKVKTLTILSKMLDMESPYKLV